MNRDKREVAATIKRIVCDGTDLGLTPEQIGDEQPLFEGPPGAVGLDSIEALELVVGLEEAFGFTIDPQQINVVEKFYSVDALSDYVLEMTEGRSDESADGTADGTADGEPNARPEAGSSAGAARGPDGT